MANEERMLGRIKYMFERKIEIFWKLQGAFIYFFSLSLFLS